MKKCIALVGLFVLVACSFAWAAGNREEAAIQAMKEAFEENSRTLVAGEAEAWANRHAEDVGKMRPNAPATRSREDLLEGLRASLQGNEFTAFDIQIIKSEVHGDMALSWGVYTWEARPRSGRNTLSFDGKFLTVFKKQSDGRWLIAYDCYNSNVPPH